MISLDDFVLFFFLFWLFSLSLHVRHHYLLFLDSYFLPKCNEKGHIGTKRSIFVSPRVLILCIFYNVAFRGPVIFYVSITMQWLESGPAKIVLIDSYVVNVKSVEAFGPKVHLRGRMRWSVKGIPISPHSSVWNIKITLTTLNCKSARQCFGYMICVLIETMTFWGE